MLTGSWKIQLLGSLCVEHGDRLVTRFRSRKTAALLAYLAYYRDHSHPREVLIELLWPEVDAEAGNVSLRVALNSLRKQLEPPGIPAGAVIVADRSRLGLRSAAVTTDVAQFEAALRSAARAPSETEACGLLAQAVEQYAGELLPGYDGEWIAPERARLADAYLGALRRLIRHHAEARRFDAALEYAHRALRVDPLREETHRAVMLLYAALGRTASAVRQFQELERVLRDEMEAVPSAPLRKLAWQLRQRLSREAALPLPTVAAPETGNAEPAQEVEQGSDRSPHERLHLRSRAPAELLVPAGAPSSLPLHRGNLPCQVTRFFGREAEIARLQSVLSPRTASGGDDARHATDPTRLVTLTGPGGIGKTRLALIVAERLHGSYPGGVWWVPLADLSEGRWIASAVLDALGQIRAPQSDHLQQVVTALSGPPALLLLDNLEHLVQEGAAVVLTLLERVPTLTCLVTSRQELEIAGEHVFAVAPLPTPGRGPQSSVFSVKEDTNDPKPATSSPRHSTRDSPHVQPEAMLQFASVQLFVDRAQSVVPDFQLTPGNVAAVAALCVRLEGIPLAVELAAARIRVVTPAQMHTRLSERFELLVSRRRDLAPRHRSLRAAVEWSFQFLPPALQCVLATLSLFRGGWNLAAAEAVCDFGGDKEPAAIRDVALPAATPPSGIEALEHLYSCSLIQVERDGAEVRFGMLETLREFAAEHLPPAERERAAVRHARYFLALAEEAEPFLREGSATIWLDRLEREHDNLRAALGWLEARAQGEAGLRLGGALWRFWGIRGCFTEGREHLARVLALPGAEAREAARAKTLYGAGHLAFAHGDTGAARGYWEECLAIQRELGEMGGIASALRCLGNAARDQGDMVAAGAHWEESLAIYRDLDRGTGIAWTLMSLGNLAHDVGDAATAQTYFQECLTMFRDLGDTIGIANTLRSLGYVAQAQQHYAEAQAFLQESLARYRELGHKPGIAWGLHTLGVAAYDQEDCVLAHGLFVESLGIHRELGRKPAIVQTLEGLAAVALARAQWSRAARLFGTAEACREAMGLRGAPWRSWRPPQRETLPGTHGAVGLDPTATPERPDPSPAMAKSVEHDRFVATLRTALGEEAFAAAWAEGRAMALEEAMTRAMEPI